MNRYAMLPKHDKYHLHVTQRVHNDSLDAESASEYRRMLRQKMMYHAAELLTHGAMSKITERRDAWSTLLTLELYVLTPDEFFNAVLECAYELTGQQRVFEDHHDRTD